MDQDMDRLIAVDHGDRALKACSKAICHDGDGICHRAFSVFIFDGRGHVLIHKRSKQKRLWPEFWSNSCCSHPRWEEKVEDAVVRRVREELGMSLARLEFAYKFEYHARFGDAGSEWEICHVFLARSGDSVQSDPAEVEAWQWMEPGVLSDAMARTPDRFTPWFKMEWAHLQAESMLQNYARARDSKTN